MRVLVERCDVHIGVDDFNFIINLDIRRGQFARAHFVHDYRLRAVAVHFNSQALQVQDDFGDILFHAGNGGKFMLHTFDVNSRRRRSGQRG